MKNTKRYLLFFGFSSVVILLLSILPNINLGINLAFAFTAEIPLGVEATLPHYVNYFFTFAIRLAISLAVLVIIFGGVLWLISFGMGKITSEGKDWIKAGILGLAILLSSWLILHTINPDLISLDYFPLPLIPGLPVTPPNGLTGPTVPTITYDEIPIGRITENLLARTMDSCFEFDSKGEPIDKNPETADIIEPTLIEHDRADCLLKLAGAIEAKTKIVSDLSTAITALINQCKCDGITCDLPPCECSYSELCHYYGGSGICQGSCIDAHCLEKEGDCCPPNIRDQIEHGPVDILFCGNKASLNQECTTECVEQHPTQPYDECLKECIKRHTEEYDGLDEFRNLIPDDQILSAVETDNQIKKNVWDGLNLVNKLIYLKEKIKTIQKDIEKDLKVLNDGEKQLSSCILAKPYVDFLKLVETTDKTKLSIAVNENTKDPITDKIIDVSKYCKGFEYSNSQCFQSCQNQCPITNRDKIKNCACPEDDPDCSEDENLKDKKECVIDAINDSPCPGIGGTFQSCLESCRNKCLSSCYEESDEECSNEWDECQNNCDENDADCLDSCDWDYIDCVDAGSCPDELQRCQNACYKDSESLIVNQDQCYFNYEGLIQCANLKRCTGTLDSCETDNDCDISLLQICDPISPASLKECFQNVFLCKYCSDQNAGDPECLKKSPWDEYSSLYLYQNPSRQKQEKCVQNEPVKRCASDKGRTDKECTNDTQCDTAAGQKCQEFVIETPSECWKCPTCSNCPDCPLLDCDDKFVICQNACNRDKELNRAGYNEDECFDSCDWDYVDCVGNNDVDTVDESLLTSTAQCQDYAYDDDPLTFYCFNNLNIPWLGKFEGWWFDTSEKNPMAIGKERTCSKSGEIPIGQTIDDAEAWAQELLSASFSEKTDDMVKYIIRIGNENPESYCKCDSVCDDGKGACGGTCTYWEIAIPDFDENGIPLGTFHFECGCGIAPCSGNPCLKMISLLVGGNCAEKAQGIASYYQEIKTTFEELKDIITKGRSETLKRLVYSRKQMDGCSNVRANFGTDVKILSCKRVEDNLIPPIRDGKVIIEGKILENHCYGKVAGQVLKISEPMADNWFCCEQMVK